MSCTHWLHAVYLTVGMRKAMTSGAIKNLQILGLNAIRELETPDGILASGRDEAYGCVFGRDSLITAIGLLRLHERTPDPYYLALAQKVLRSLSNLQGRYHNLES